MNLRGLRVTRRKNAPPTPGARHAPATILVSLPREAWDALVQGCACGHCKTTGEPSYQDTLAIACPAPAHGDTTWMVHAPHLRAGRDYCACADCMASRRADSERALRAAEKAQ
jgi:hypothetical protein